MRGRKPNSPRLKELGRPGLTTVPTEAVGAPVGDETPSEQEAETREASIELEDAPADARRGGGPPGEEPPDWMENEDARQLWRQMLPELKRRRQFVSLFATELARYCVAFGQYVRAVREIEKSGAVTKSSKGVKMLSQEWIVASRAHEMMAKLAGDLGFNPVAQVRIAGLQLDLFDQPPQSAEPTRATGTDNVTPFGQFRRT